MELSIVNRLIPTISSTEQETEHIAELSICDPNSG